MSLRRASWWRTTVWGVVLALLLRLLAPGSAAGTAHEFQVGLAAGDEGEEDADAAWDERHPVYPEDLGDDDGGMRMLQQEAERAAQFRAVCQHLFAELDDFYKAHQGSATTYFDLERFAVARLLHHFHMEVALLAQTPLQQNWLEVLYHKIRERAPSVLFTGWWDYWGDDDDDDDGVGPTDDELEILLRLDPSPLQSAELDPATGERVFDRDALLRQVLEPFRHRGAIPRVLGIVRRRILSPLETVSYAIPSTDNLQTLAHYAPLVELGAGTGYWTAALQSLLEVDAVAFDAEPPRPPAADDDDGRPPNHYFGTSTYTDVRRGTCREVFSSPRSSSNGSHGNDNYANRTLLLVWPNNPDNVDNAPEFRSDALPPVWDHDCVEAFVAAGGTAVALVAEREVHVPRAAPNAPPDAGLSATRQLQEYLRAHFDLLEQQPVLTWYYRDDLTVWRLKAATEPGGAAHPTTAAVDPPEPLVSNEKK